MDRSIYKSSLWHWVLHCTESDTKYHFYPFGVLAKEKLPSQAAATTASAGLKIARFVLGREDAVRAEEPAGPVTQQSVLFLDGLFSQVAGTRSAGTGLPSVELHYSTPRTEKEPQINWILFCFGTHLISLLSFCMNVLLLQLEAESERIEHKRWTVFVSTGNEAYGGGT